MLRGQQPAEQTQTFFSRAMDRTEVSQRKGLRDNKSISAVAAAVRPSALASSLVDT